MNKSFDGKITKNFEFLAYYLHKNNWYPLNEIINSSDVIIIGNYDKDFIYALNFIKAEQFVVDLVNIVDTKTTIRGNYYGICW